jgi:hypothetical protein
VADDQRPIEAAAPGGPEPEASAARLTGEMTDPRTPPDAASRHAAHDVLLIAALADRDPDALRSFDREHAERWVATCADCAALHADLVALAAAAPSAAVPSRPRDFRLTPEQAAHLRPNAWRRFIGAIGSSRDAFTRPLAIGLTTMGIAGLLVATVPMLSAGGASSAQPGYVPIGSKVDQTSGAAGAAPLTDGSRESATDSGNTIAAAAPSAAASIAAAPVAAASAAPAAAASAAPDNLGAPGPGTVGGVSPDQAVGNPESATAAGSPATTGDSALLSVSSPFAETSPLLLLASAMLLGGLGLFALRWTARRLGDG